MKIHSILHSQARTFLKKKQSGHICKLDLSMSRTLSTDERFENSAMTTRCCSFDRFLAVEMNSQLIVV